MSKAWARAGLSTVGLLVLMCLILVSWALVDATAAWRNSGNWNWNTGDLSGSNSLQVAVDELDARLDGIGIGSEGDTTIPAITVTTNIAQLLVLPSTTLNVVHGSVVTATTSRVILNGLGCTVTVANASVAGQLLVLSGGAATNVIVLDTGNWEGAVTLGIEDQAVAIAHSTAQWDQLLTKDNTP
jgi:hypothetical protein